MPPSVMMLIVSPSALNTKIEHRMESGMDMAMIIVLRQLPRNTRIMMAVRQAAMSASRTHAVDGRPDKDGLIGHRLDFQFRRKGGAICGRTFRTPAMMSSVDTLPFF